MGTTDGPTTTGAPPDVGQHSMDRTTTVVVVAGLTVGWVLGLGGTVMASGSTAQNVAWVISSIALVAGTGLLTVWFVRDDLLLMAGGCLVFTIGEVVIHAQGPGAVDAFGAASFAYVVALFMTAASPWPPMWARVASLGSAIAFAIHAATYLGGNMLGPDNTPAGIGYGLLAATLIGWSWRLLRAGRAAA